MRIYCQRQRCSPRSVVSGDMPIFSGFAGEVRAYVVSLSWECVRSSKMLVFWLFSFDRYICRMKFRSSPLALDISKFTRLRAVSLIATARLLLSLVLVVAFATSHSGPTHRVTFWLWEYVLGYLLNKLGIMANRPLEWCVHVGKRVGVC